MIFRQFFRLKEQEILTFYWSFRSMHLRKTNIYPIAAKLAFIRQDETANGSPGV